MNSADEVTSKSWQPTFPILFVLLLGITTADQLTKSMIVKSLSLGQSITVIQDFLHFTLVYNSGMAFGLFSSSNIPFKSALLTILALSATGVISYYVLQTPLSERLTRLGLVLVLGGAIGNIIDRIRLGYVVDFIDVFYQNIHWPAFNIADSCICIGVGFLIVDNFTSKTKTLPKETNLVS